MRKALRVLDAVEITVDERAAINLRETEGGGIAWDNDARTWDITLADPDAAALITSTLATHEWSGADARRALALCDKFGVE